MKMEEASTSRLFANEGLRVEKNELRKKIQMGSENKDAHLNAQWGPTYRCRHNFIEALIETYLNAPNNYSYVIYEIS